MVVWVLGRVGANAVSWCVVGVGGGGGTWWMGEPGRGPQGGGHGVGGWVGRSVRVGGWVGEGRREGERKIAGCAE